MMPLMICLVGIICVGMVIAAFLVPIPKRKERQTAEITVMYSPSATHSYTRGVPWHWTVRFPDGSVRSGRAGHRWSAFMAAKDMISEMRRVEKRNKSITKKVRY